MTKHSCALFVATLSFRNDIFHGRHFECQSRKRKGLNNKLKCHSEQLAQYHSGCCAQWKQNGMWLSLILSITPVCFPLWFQMVRVVLDTAPEPFHFHFIIPSTEIAALPLPSSSDICPHGPPTGNILILTIVGWRLTLCVVWWWVEGQLWPVIL